MITPEIRQKMDIILTRAKIRVSNWQGEPPIYILYDKKADMLKSEAWPSVEIQHQLIKEAIEITGGDVIHFNKKHYRKWLNGRNDTTTLRAQWAGYFYDFKYRLGVKVGSDAIGYAIYPLQDIKLKGSGND